MVVGYSRALSATSVDRVRRTVALLRRRGYALSPSRLGEVCLGGSLSEREVRWAVAASSDLFMAEDLVVEPSGRGQVRQIRNRVLAHAADSHEYTQMAIKFTRRLVAVAPFIRSVSIAGSLASGGFRASDDVDLNLIVEDGYRHIAYVVVNIAGLVHALSHRAKPVDYSTRRPIAPRLMTANLILERSQCFSLRRQDEDMAFELLVSEPVFGAEVLDEVVASNPALQEHFPQLTRKAAPLAIDVPARRLPKWLFPSVLDGAARRLGELAWRYMQWTRRHSPEALARVAFVRATMQPYTLFDRPPVD